MSGTIWTNDNLVQDIQTIIDYVKDNWGLGTTTYIEPPEEIWYDMGQNGDYEKNKIRQVWQYRRSIKLHEGSTEYSLLDMQGNADRNNDTGMSVTVYSKKGYVDADGMYRRFIQLIRTLAKTNVIGTYAFTQVSSMEPTKARYYGRIDAVILLTRRGKGHA